MDKRPIIGLLLIFLILVVWQILFLRRPEIKREPPKKEIKKEVVSVVKEAEVEKLDTVDTKLFFATINRIGAAISSIKLKKYKGVKEAWVEIIPKNRASPKDVLIIKNKEVDLSNKEFKLKEREKNKLIYTTETELGEVQKIYTFDDTSYLFELSIIAPGIDKYKIVWDAGINFTEKNEEAEIRYFAGAAKLAGTIVMKHLSELDTIPKGEPGSIDWIGVKNKYFLSAIIPKIETENYSMKRGALGNVGGGCAAGCAQITKDPEAKRLQMTLLTKSNTNEYKFNIYIGGLDYNMLSRFGLQDACYFGWRWIRPISRFFLRILLFLHRGVKNYGLVIILFSLILNITFSPLTMISFTSAIKMQKLQPKILELQKKYKNEPRKLNQAMIELYRKEGVSPFSGCLPLLIQMPVFVALYAILDTTIAMRQAVFISGWIEDLSQNDPYYILPILMGIMVFLQQKMQSGDIKEQTQQQKMMRYFMPIVFTFIFFNFPAGLVLYWLCCNIFSIIQIYFMRKRIKMGT